MAKIRYGRPPAWNMQEGQYDGIPASNEHYQTYSAVDGDTVVGTASFTTPRYGESDFTRNEATPDYPNNTLFDLTPGEVDQIAVHPEYRRQGIARNLISLIERNHGGIGHPPKVHEGDSRPGPIAGDSLPMAHSSDLSDESYALANKLSLNRYSGAVSPAYINNGSGDTSYQRDIWSRMLTQNVGGARARIATEYPDPSQRSSPAKGPIHTRRSGGKIGPSRKRSLNIIPSATQLELPFTDGNN